MNGILDNLDAALRLLDSAAPCLVRAADAADAADQIAAALREAAAFLDGFKGVAASADTIDTTRANLLLTEATRLSHPAAMAAPAAGGGFAAALLAKLIAALLERLIK